MKKRFWISLLALPALAFAAPSAGDFIEAYKERLNFFAEVLSPSTTSPDNVIKRYATFRATMYKQMPEHISPMLPFAWGEPIFFRLEDFFEAGDEDGWLVDDADELKGYAVAISNAVYYPLWVYERMDEESGERKWVIASRGKKSEDLYEVDVNPGYAPHAPANALLKALRLTPTRDDAGAYIDDDEGMFMTHFYNMLDPARFRMAVNLMDYNDFLLLQSPAIKGDDDNGGGTPPPTTPPATITNNFNVASLPYTNILAFAASPRLDTYTLANSTASAHDTFFYVTNSSPHTIEISWTTNSVSRPAGKYSLNAWQDFGTNVVLHTNVKISVALPISSTSHWYGLVWENPLDWF